MAKNKLMWAAILVVVVILIFLLFNLGGGYSDLTANQSGLSKQEKKEIEKFMPLAIKEAEKSAKKGGIPVGAVLIRDGKVLGKGFDMRLQKKDPLKHAEISAIENAGKLKNYEDVVLYTTLTPCFMCSGAIIQLGIKKVVVCESGNFTLPKGLFDSNGITLINLDAARCKNLINNYLEKHSDTKIKDFGG